MPRSSEYWTAALSSVSGNIFSTSYTISSLPFFSPVQEHSSLLIEKLQTEQKNKRAFAASAEDDDDQELNGDIGRLLAQYDAGLSQRRQELLNGLVEGAEEEDVKLAATVRRKDDQHQSRTRELERQVKQKNTFCSDF